MAKISIEEVKNRLNDAINNVNINTHIKNIEKKVMLSEIMD